MIRFLDAYHNQDADTKAALEDLKTDAMEGVHTEICKRCKGKGVRWTMIDGMRSQFTCGTCKGLGEKTYAASAEKRAHTNAVAKARKARKLAEAIAAFQADHPLIWAWMEESEPDAFGGKMKAALLKWGGLTDRQFQASDGASRRKKPRKWVQDAVDDVGTMTEKEQE